MWYGRRGDCNDRADELFEMKVVLSDVASGRNNNLNLIRFVAASLVLVSHSFAFVTGRMFDDPLSRLVGLEMGSLAVNIFFITSGFLVTGSLFNHSSVRSFIWARMLRIYPALVVAVIFTVVLGAFFTKLPVSEYFFHSDSWLFVVRNATALWPGLPLRLHDVFSANPISGVLNGSLWTLPWELGLYMALAVGGMLMALGLSARQLKILLLCVGVISTLYYNYLYVAGKVNPFSNIYNFARFTSFFFIGSGLYVLKDKIIFSMMSLLLCCGAIWLAVILNKAAGLVTINVLLAYVVLYLAYVPSGVTTLYNRLGDYSYGMYIFAFPVQQSLVAMYPNITILELCITSFVVTLALAMLSWNFIEKRIMANRKPYGQKTWDLFSRFRRAS